MEQVLQAVVSLGEIIPFFPKGSLSDDLIAECLFEFIGDERQLEWFANAAVRRLSKYEGPSATAPALSASSTRPPTESNLSSTIPQNSRPRNQCLKRSMYRMREMEEDRPAPRRVSPPGRACPARRPGTITTSRTEDDPHCYDRRRSPPTP